MFHAFVSGILRDIVEEEKVGGSEESVEKVTDHWREVEEEEEEDTVDIEGEATESGGVEYVE